MFILLFEHIFPFSWHNFRTNLVQWCLAVCFICFLPILSYASHLPLAKKSIKQSNPSNKDVKVGKAVGLLSSSGKKDKTEVSNLIRRGLG